MDASNTHQTSRIPWSTSHGHFILQKLIKDAIPQWSTGAKGWQVPVIQKALDGIHTITVAPTGGGKSALFFLPVIVHRELAKNPSLWHSQTFVINLLAIVVLPLNAIADTLIPELEGFGLRVTALNKKTIDQARTQGRDLIGEAKEANIILLGPEQLLSAAFNETILNNPAIRRRLLLVGIDELHMISVWGPQFRVAYHQLGHLRARLPFGTPIVGATATLTAKSLTSISNTLGFKTNDFTFTRHSNERSIRFAIRQLTHNLAGQEFPDIAWIAKAPGRSIVFCRTLDTCTRVTRYLRSLIVGTQAHKYRVIRIYTAQVMPEDALETLTLMSDQKSECLAVVATIRLALGVHLPNIRNVAILGDFDDVDDLLQKAGRAGRNGGNATCTAYVEPSVMKKAKEIAEGGGMQATTKKRVRQGRGESEGMDAGKASLYTSTTCLVAKINQMYDNPGLPSSLSCIEAKRPAPCDVCVPAPVPSTDIAMTIPKKSRPPTVCIPRKHREYARDMLVSLRHQLYFALEDKSSSFLPEVAILPDSIIDHTLAKFKTFTSEDSILRDPHFKTWAFLGAYSRELFKALEQIRSDLDLAPKASRPSKQSVPSDIATSKETVPSDGHGASPRASVNTSAGENIEQATAKAISSE